VTVLSQFWIWNSACLRSIQSEQFEDDCDNHDHADEVKYTVTHIISDSNRLSSLRVWITKSADRSASQIALFKRGFAFGSEVSPISCSSWDTIGSAGAGYLATPARLSSARADFLGLEASVRRGSRERLTMKRTAKIRYAVVGLGHLSQVAILPAFSHARRSELGVLISGDEAKSRLLSQKYGVPTLSYDDFEKALANEKIDASFIVLPNSMHREFTERAAKSSVHVLCEKPMATNEKDCEAMIRACDRANVKLMIAYRLHFTDSQVQAIKLARTGKLGELRVFDSLFAMQVDRDNIRVKQETGGGPLLDIGVYCINAARFLFGAEPTEVAAMAATSQDPRFKEVDEMVSALLRFPGDRLATFTCSFGAHEISEYRLVGTDAILYAEPAYNYANPMHWKIRRGTRETKKTFPKGDQFAAEMDYFSSCIIENRTPEPSGTEGLADLRIIRAINEAARRGRSVKLGTFKKLKRPDARQEIKRPSVKKPPRPVKAAAPHS
jgi:predicted dehydrogenase